MFCIDLRPLKVLSAYVHIGQMLDAGHQTDIQNLVFIEYVWLHTS